MSPYFLLLGCEPPMIVDRLLNPAARIANEDFWRTNIELLPLIRRIAAQRN